jgi:hypothetical protein
MQFMQGLVEDRQRPAKTVKEIKFRFSTTYLVRKQRQEAAIVCSRMQVYAGTGGIRCKVRRRQ